MQFNSHADDQDIVSLTGDLVNTSTTEYPLKSITRSANMRMREIWTWIFDAYGGWRFDDSNQSDLPEATVNVVSGTGDYALPAGSHHLYGIEIKDSGGTWTKLTPITLEEIHDRSGAEGDFETTNGDPKYYRMLGQTIKLYPTPNYASTDGLKVFFSRDISAFASTDTTKTPGFDSAFHEAVAVGAALTFAQRKNLEVRKDLQVEWVRYEQRIRKYYSEKFKELFPSRFHTRDAVRDSM